MKNPISFLLVILVGITLLFYRSAYPGQNQGLKITTWDAYGYYLYLPSSIIYKDMKGLGFKDSIDQKYQLSGGNFYQASKHEETGNYVFKYLGGVALMHLPLFLSAHLYAGNSQIYPADGFSAPYQNAIGFGVVFYVIIGLFILRKVLLKYYSDQISALTLILLVLASNAIQYISIDSAQSHAPIFVLYCLILYLTLQWHEKPRLLTAFFAGYVIGLATISRPTEAIMVLIPILWNTHNKTAAKEKWTLVKEHMPMVYLAAIGGLLGILPQLLYWKYVTGHFIYDVGSAWRFLNPFFRVLFGFEKGWFIYTPVTLFFVAGLFFLKNLPFRKSLIWFCGLNIWIIISWSDWRYGGSYSTRALMQSYPVFALALGAFIQRIWNPKTNWLIAVAAIYLVGVNLFQIQQYNQTVLHYYDMNKAYYSRIYLNPHPSPLDMSLLDNPDWIREENDYAACTIFQKDSAQTYLFNKDSLNILFEAEPKLKGVDFLRIDATLQSPVNNGWLMCELINGDSVKQNKVRFLYPNAQAGKENDYSFYASIPSYFKDAKVRIRVYVHANESSLVKSLGVTGLTKAE